MTTVEFVGGPMDGQTVTSMADDDLRRELLRVGHWYGLLDVYVTRDDAYLVYGHIEDATDAPT